MAKRESVKPVEEAKAKATTGAVKTPVKPVEEAKPVKVYKFTSENKYLTVTSLGIQFINGKASTTDLGVAKALATIDGVELVDE